MNVVYVSGTVSGTGDLAANKKDKTKASYGTFILLGLGSGETNRKGSK